MPSYTRAARPTHARGYDLGYTHTFSTTVVNEAHIAYNRDNYGYQPPMYGDYVSKDLAHRERQYQSGNHRRERADRPLERQSGVHRRLWPVRGSSEYI